MRDGGLSFRRGACRCRSIAEGSKAEGELEVELVREVAGEGERWLCVWLWLWLWLWFGVWWWGLEEGALKGKEVLVPSEER